MGERGGGRRREREGGRERGRERGRREKRTREREKTEDKCLRDKVKLTWMSRKRLALECVHSMNCMYRDLKPENCLVDEKGHLKMADFGFAKEVNKNGRLFSKVGTPHYLAPEQVGTWEW